MAKRTDGAMAAAVFLLAVVAILLLRAPAVATWLAQDAADARAATLATQALVKGERPPVRVLTPRDGYDPIVTFDPADKAITVTDHVAADVLLCITPHQGAAPVCKLTRDWVQP